MTLGVPHAASAGGIAWFAHIGGFLFGMLFHRFFVSFDPPDLPPRQPKQLYRY
jgi:membrane associated rhomboid family serine protease